MTKEQTEKRRKPGTLANIRTAVTARVHSKPPAEGQEYLELWTLKRERARWARDKAQAEQRIQSLDKALSKLHLPEENQPVSSVGPEVPPVARTIDFSNSPRQ